MRSASLLAILFCVVLFFGSNARAAQCAHPVTFCDTKIPPNCTKRCFNTIVTPDGQFYSIKLQDVPSNLAPDVAGRAGVGDGQVFHSGSRLLLKGLSKESVPLVLDRLKINKSTVNIPE